MDSGILELVRAGLPHIPLDKGVAQANTGSVLLDSLPLLTMAPAGKTLQLYWRRGRYLDFSLFLGGFLLALVYHWLHMHPEGIANAEFLGLSGPTWRGLDILMAQALLARTCGHAVGARSPVTQLLSNLVFPAGLLIYAHLLADGVLTLGVASRVLVMVLLATLATKAALEGFGSLPKYCPRRGKRTLACFAFGFLAFPMPEIFPRHYWLFHSLWHILMAEGYHLLYLQLEGLHLQQAGAEAGAKAARRRRSAARPCAQGMGGAAAGHLPAGYAPDSPLAGPSSLEGDSASLSSSLDDSVSSSSCFEGEGEGVGEETLLPSSGQASEEDSDASQESGEAPPSAVAPGSGSGFVYALLQPAARLMLYQRQQQRLERRRRRAASARKDL